MKFQDVGGVRVEVVLAVVVGERHASIMGNHSAVGCVGNEG